LPRSARSRAPASPAPGHKIFQYLPRGLAIERPNQVWCSDIRGGHGLGEPDGAAWRLTNTMDSSFCISALQEALARFGRPEIFNTHQGIEISMFHPDVMSDVNSSPATQSPDWLIRESNARVSTKPSCTDASIFLSTPTACQPLYQGGSGS
jgi:hypothetical protein